MPMARTMAVQRVAEKLCSTSVNSVVTCISGDLDALCLYQWTFDLIYYIWVRMDQDMWISLFMSFPCSCSFKKVHTCLVSI